MAQGFTMPEQATRAVAYLYFDGINLHYHDDTRMGRAVKLWSYPAISGEHGFQAPALTKHTHINLANLLEI